jgi:ATP-binding cassette, subfamily F, member 3
LRPLKKEQQQAEEKMAALEGEKAALEAALAQPMEPAQIAEAGRRLKAVTEELAWLEHRWLELGEAIDNMAPNDA